MINFSTDKFLICISIIYLCRKIQFTRKWVKLLSILILLIYFMVSVEELKCISSPNACAISVTVPFYVYDSPQTNWLINCSEHNNLLDQASDIEHHWHHGDDVIFARRILNHPWRTRNPKEADVFIIPTLLGWFSGFDDHSHDEIIGRRSGHETFLGDL